MPRHDHASLVIDLPALAANFTLLAEKVAPAVCAAVVKADAYGLGVEQIAPALHKAGCRKFYVATMEEGVQLRSLLPTVDISILHGPTSQKQAESQIIHRLHPVLNHEEQVRWWNAANAEQGPPRGATLHIDTGMHRLGVERSAINKFTGLSTGEDALITLWMSHMACPEQPGHPLNQAQRDRVAQLRKQLPDMPFSLANSSGIFLGSCYHHDEVRPGAALYGINPTPGKPNPMQTVVTCQAPILQKRTVTEAGTVGYGATCEVQPGTRLAVVACGYADGILRAASNRAQAVMHHAAGRTEVPYVGRVSMDMLVLDVTAVPEGAMDEDSYAELFGPHMPLDRLAESCDTIGYEILTRLGARLHRQHINAG